MPPEGLQEEPREDLELPVSSWAGPREDLLEGQPVPPWAGAREVVLSPCSWWERPWAFGLVADPPR